MSLIDNLLHQATVRKCPISGTFELTARCNLSCKMCYIHNMSCDKSLRDTELSTEQWIRIADEAKNNGTLLLLLTGGEPTLRTDFCEIYRACAERGFLLTINTNATLLSQEIFDLFREHPPLRINASLYGMSADIYKSMCGNAEAFSRAINNIQTLRAMGIGVQINFAATPYNMDEVEKVAAFAKQIGANVQHTAYMFPPTRVALPCREPSLRFSPEEAAEQMLRYLRIGRSEQELIAYCRDKINQPPRRIDGCGTVYEGVRCRAGRGSYWITHDGKMLPCGMIENIAFPVLSDGFLSAWNQIVATFGELKMPSGCTSCPDYDRCDVCPAICYAENDSFCEVPEYICKRNSAYRELMSNIVNAKEAHE